MRLFSKEIRVPKTLVIDSAKAETSDEVKQFCINIVTTLKSLEQGTLWANLAKLQISMLTSNVSKDMTENNSPIKIWDNCAERCASVIF